MMRIRTEFERNVCVAAGILGGDEPCCLSDPSSKNLQTELEVETVGLFGQKCCVVDGCLCYECRCFVVVVGIEWR